MSFDRIAPHYDWLEVLTAGSRLQRARTRWLDRLSDRAEILSVGEGHGRFATACALRFPQAHLTCVEPCDGMWTRATRRFSRAGVPFGQVERLSVSLPSESIPIAGFDAIVTCFFLDCLTPEQLEQTVAVLGRSARPGAVWLNADFAIPAQGLRHWRARGIHALMYAFFRLATRLPARRLCDPSPWLEQAGFRLSDRSEFEWGLIRSDCWHRNTP